MTIETKYPYITGMCAVGACENTKKLSPGGALYKSCQGEFNFRSGKVTCTHDCHDQFRQIRELMASLNKEMEGIATIPSPVTEGNPASHTSTDSPISFVSDPLRPPAAPVVPADARRTRIVDTSHAFKQTTSGRAAPGQLEERVRVNIATSVVEAGSETIALLGITPAVVAKQIDANNPPSQGAIHAIFMRWQAAGYIEVGKKPFRFIKFTQAGERALLR